MTDPGWSRALAATATSSHAADRQLWEMIAAARDDGVPLRTIELATGIPRETLRRKLTATPNDT